MAKRFIRLLTHVLYILQRARTLDRLKHAHATVLRALIDVDVYKLSATSGPCRPTAGQLLHTRLSGLKVSLLSTAARSPPSVPLDLFPSPCALRS